MNLRVQSQQPGPRFETVLMNQLLPLCCHTYGLKRARSSTSLPHTDPTAASAFGLTGGLAAWGVRDILTSIPSSSKGRDNRPDGSMLQATSLLSYKNNK